MTTTDTEPTLDELVRRVARGDEAAFERVYDSVAGAVYGLSLRIVRDPGMAEDVSQEVLVAVWREATRFDAGRGSAMSWVMTLTHRRAVDRVRREESQSSRVTRAARELPTVEPVVNDVFEQVAVSLDAARVRAAMQQLTPLQREAVELAYFGGHTHTQVGEVLDIPLGTAKARIRDGLIKLRDALGVNP